MKLRLMPIHQWLGRAGKSTTLEFLSNYHTYSKFGSVEVSSEVEAAYICLYKGYDWLANWLPFSMSMTRMKILKSSEGAVNCSIGVARAFTEHTWHIEFFPRAIPSQDSIFSKHFEAQLVNDGVWYELITSQCNCLNTFCSLTEGNDWNATVSHARMTKT